MVRDVPMVSMGTMMRVPEHFAGRSPWSSQKNNSEMKNMRLPREPGFSMSSLVTMEELNLEPMRSTSKNSQAVPEKKLATG